MKKNILLILPANNFSSEEFLLIKNIIQKDGYNVFISSDTNALCIADNHTKVKADVSIFNIHAENFLAIIFIGGNGVRNDWDNKSYQNIARKFFEQNKIVGAICASPIILSRAGLLSNRNATCFPSDRKEIEKDGVCYLDSGVVVDGNLITGQSSSDSEHFAQIIIRRIQDGKYG